MVKKTLDWLNQNRFRAYPFVNDDGLSCNDTRVPTCVLLDCLVMDTRHLESVPELIFTGIEITNEFTKVTFSYNGSNYFYTILPDQIDSSSSSPEQETDYFADVKVVDGTLIQGLGNEFVYIKFVFSSHNYILHEVGVGNWIFKGKILPTKIISVTASGVSGLSVNGSFGVAGFENAGIAVGDVHLVDGYRTQPVIQNGSVVVKVGTMYGEDPCRYSDGFIQPEEGTSCDNLLLFFCGQNGIDSGDVAIEGGPGVSVKQGGTYKARTNIIDTYGNVGIAAGEEIPCIEIAATTDLINIYRPTV